VEVGRRVGGTVIDTPCGILVANLVGRGVGLSIGLSVAGSFCGIMVGVAKLPEGEAIGDAKGLGLGAMLIEMSESICSSLPQNCISSLVPISAGFDVLS